MASKGRIYLVGRGENRVNPIHGSDLAVVCADVLDSNREEIDVGGPEIFTYRRIAEMSFEALGKPPKITGIPIWLMKMIVSIVGVFNKRQAELLAFFNTMMTSDVVAPETGKRTLESHFNNLASQSR